jgi:hypothetical protein
VDTAAREGLRLPLHLRDASRYGGAITVARDPSRFGADPFARLFPGTVAQTDLFCEVAPPAGPPIERYAGVPWPGGRF